MSDVCVYIRAVRGGYLIEFRSNLFGEGGFAMTVCQTLEDADVWLATSDCSDHDRPLLACQRGLGEERR
jgi:hypothetical protein